VTVDHIADLLVREEQVDPATWSRGPLKRTAGIPDIGHAKQRREAVDLARSPIVFVIVQETRDPRFQ
jgi:hypothetical protein